MNQRGLWMLLAAMALLSGCSPERDCQDGLKRLKPRVEGALGTGAHAEAIAQINQAYSDMADAERLAAQGQFEACLAKIDSARALLNKSQRTNQQ